MSQSEAVATPKAHGAHEAHHEELGFWRKYVFSTDHKTIGIQYAITALLFLFFGFSLMMLLRWQLAYPGAPLPLLGRLLGDERMPGGTMLPDFYNQLGAMHGTIMVFLGVVPLAVGGFGNFVLPLQIGAQDMAFPRLNMESYWFFFLGGVTMLASFFGFGAAFGFRAFRRNNRGHSGEFEFPLLRFQRNRSGHDRGTRVRQPQLTTRRTMGVVSSGRTDFLPTQADRLCVC